jgi:hypothetical protein
MPHNLARLLRVTMVAAPLLGAGSARSAMVATVIFDPANAASTAIIVNGGYTTPFGTALHSGTSPDWSVGTSLGTLFQVPTFQFGYDPGQPVVGEPGSAVTLGHDERFPKTWLNDRDAIRLGWGDGRGLGNGDGADLAIFEAATSEAFAVRLHGVDTGWSYWRYTPYLSEYDEANDATPTLIDFTDFGLGTTEIVNALEIANLLDVDTVDTALAGTLGLGYGTVYFGGSTSAGKDLTPARYSSSQLIWTPFESTKFDPDIQYAVGLRPIVQSGVPIALSATSAPASLLLPYRAATAMPEPGPLVLALALLPLLLREAHHKRLVRFAP